jgi:hypothetical protein
VARTNLTANIQPFTKQVILNPTYSALTGFTGFQWSNTGREIVAVINGATASTYTINVGATVLGQAVAAFTGNLPTSNTAPQFFGPFPSQFNQPDGLNSIFFDVGTVTTVTVAILQLPGVS